MSFPASRTVLRARRGWLAPGLILAGTMAVVGCGGSNAAPTNVGQEELFRTGNFNYDEYFEDVYGLQGSAHHAEEDEKTARVPLGRALGIGEASLDRMLGELKSTVEAQAQTKARVHFKLEGIDEQGAPLPGRVITVTAAASKGRTLPRDAAELTLAIDQTAKAEGQVWEKYGQLPDKGRRLSEKAATLKDEVGASFATEPKNKREQIERELSAAKAVTAQIAQRCDKAAKAASTFLKQSREIFTSAANAEVKPPAKAPAKSKSAPSAPASVASLKRRETAQPPQPAAKGSGSARPGKPEPATASESAGSGDFNP